MCVDIATNVTYTTIVTITANGEKNMGGTVRIPMDIYEEVKMLAQASGKSISRLVREALDLYIKVLEERLDIEIAERRLLDVEADFIPLDKVKEEYGLSGGD